MVEEHKVKDFSKLVGQVEGMSDKQLTQHFGLYKGYVKKLNEIQGKLETADRSETNYSYGAYSELKRREAVAFNGAVLHETYFDNLTGKDTGAEGKVEELIKRDFGSMEAWETDTNASAASTPGWVLLTYNNVDHKLHNYILYEHHIGLPVKQNILLALDCWEHAFMIDYGTNKKAYLEAFIKNIDWKEVNDRFKALKLDY